jgi:carbonic anhydrase
MAKFATPAVAEQITATFGTPDVVETYAISDLRSSVAADVERAAASPHAPAGLTVSGHVYDVTTGRLEEIVPPRAVG